jgi:hypothetical protein
MQRSRGHKILFFDLDVITVEEEETRGLPFCLHRKVTISFRWAVEVVLPL